MSNLNLLVNGSTKITLTQNDYKAQGGQGIVYVKGNLAYKIYHDPTKMIPEMKVRELSAIKMPVVLAPQDTLVDSKTGTVVGFTMPFVKDTEYLTKLFSRNFKDTNNIGADTVVNLIDEMRSALGELHKKNIIVGDYNEMNFLVDADFKIPYHIDVDSYQTPNFPCNAIMDTVRDRRLPFGKFDELSDWFSWAVVTFQMYTGIHPYMGRHPSFKTTQLDERMVQRISVFDPDVKIPKACQDFSAIPKAHLEWYKKVFIDGYRSEPPIAGAFGYVPGFTAVVVTGTGSFIVDIVHDYKEKIVSVDYIAGIRYVLTTTKIFKKETEIFSFQTKHDNVKLLSVVGNEPIIAVIKAGMIKFFDIARNEVGNIACDASMVSNGVLYSIVSGRMLENIFINGHKIIHTTKVVDNIAPIFKAFDGVVVQDLFGKRRLSIPYKTGMCASVMVPELEGYRVIDAKRIQQFAEFIIERSGKYSRFMMYFSQDFKSYECKIEHDVQQQSVNMIVRQNGMKVSIIEHDTMELMMDFKRGEKRVTDCPADDANTLVDGIDRLMFISDTKLYAMKMK